MNYISLRNEEGPRFLLNPRPEWDKPDCNHSLSPNEKKIIIRRYIYEIF